MLVVIDESGDPGFKQGSSTHYVLGMVIFDSFKDAEETANTIHKLKKSIKARREFHFSHCDNRKRNAFFETINSCKFRVRIFVVEKRLIHSKKLQTDNVAFTSYFLRKFISSDYNGLNNATIKIDGSGSRIFKQGFKSYFRKHVQKEKYKTLKFCDSKNDVLIQLADMIVSAYSRPYNNPTKKDAYKWRNMIDDKVVGTWKFD